MSTDPYSNIVQLYDLEHEDYYDDVEALVQFAEFGDGPILELGCGTGRILIPLAEAGHRVVGIDSSEPMLAVATERSKQLPNVELLQADMSDLRGFGEASFGLIIASLNSIMHLAERDQRRMIETAFRTLSPGGRLIIDTLNPSADQLNHLLNATHLDGSWTTPDGTSIDKWSHRQTGSANQVLDTLIWYDQVSANGEYRRTRTRFDLRYMHQSELALLLELAGFRDIDWYGTYELEPWHSQSERILAIAHKD